MQGAGVDEGAKVNELFSSLGLCRQVLYGTILDWFPLKTGVHSQNIFDIFTITPLFNLHLKVYTTGWREPAWCSHRGLRKWAGLHVKSPWWKQLL